MGPRFITADLANFADVRRLAEAASDVDVLVNNAGVFPGGPARADKRADFDATFKCQRQSALFPDRIDRARMASRGGGSIVNISKMAATIGISGLAAYGASKAAVESFTKAWTAEYAAQGVRVNTVALGPAGTPARAAMGETFEVLASSTPAGHGATPDEIAATVSFLARDDASFVLWSDPARARRARRRLTRAGRTRESLKFLAQLVDAIDAGSRVRTAVERVR